MPCFPGVAFGLGFDLAPVIGVLSGFLVFEVLVDAVVTGALAGLSAGGVGDGVLGAAMEALHSGQIVKGLIVDAVRVYEAPRSPKEKKKTKSQN